MLRFCSLIVMVTSLLNVKTSPHFTVKSSDMDTSTCILSETNAVRHKTLLVPA